MHQCDRQAHQTAAQLTRWKRLPQLHLLHPPAELLFQRLQRDQKLGQELQLLEQKAQGLGQQQQQRQERQRQEVDQQRCELSH
jgi:hypothetical protein